MIAAKDTKIVSNEAYPVSLRGQIHRAVVFVIAAGNIGFGLLALAMPKRIGAIMDEPEDAVKRIAKNDLAAGLALASSQKRPVVPLALNAIADAREGLGWLKTKPLVAAVPLLWAALAIVAILTRDNESSLGSQ